MLRKQTKPTTFDKGDLVIIKHLRVPNRYNNVCKKLQPYLEVLTENGINSYELIYPGTSQIQGIFHIDSIYKYI